MRRLLLFGAPGSGKGTQGDLIEERYGYMKMSTGDLIREEVRKASDIGMAAKKSIDEGLLVPDSIIIDMVKKKLSDNPGIPGYIMDGFPRTLKQAEALSSIAVDDEVVFFFDVKREELIKRLTSRLYCEKCGSVFNLLTNTPKVAGICDKCGSKLTKRSDDNRDVVEKRLQVFYEKTLPVINFYREKGVVNKIDANGKIEDIFEKLTGVLV